MIIRNQQQILEAYNHYILSAMARLRTPKNIWEDVYSACKITLLNLAIKESPERLHRILYNNLLHTIGDEITKSMGQVHYGCNTSYNNHKDDPNIILNMSLDSLKTVNDNNETFNFPNTEKDDYNKYNVLWSNIKDSYNVIELMLIDFLYEDVTYIYWNEQRQRYINSVASYHRRGKISIKTIRNPKRSEKEKAKFRKIMLEYMPNVSKTLKYSKLTELARARLNKKTVELLNNTGIPIKTIYNRKNCHKPRYVIYGKIQEIQKMR